ncbi:MAG: type II secretion system F family protein [Desulfobacterales bacterium]
MPEYLYKAADNTGKVVKGQMEAPDDAGVVASLREKRLIPIRITPAASQKIPLKFSTRLDLAAMTGRVTGRDVMLFTQDLSTLIGAGLPVDRSLDILIGAAGKDGFKRIIRDIKSDVESGSYLSDALAKHPKVFSRFYVNMVKAGETGGVLEPVLERMGIFLENTQEMLETIKSALIYPLFLVLLGGVSIIILMTVVIPKFSIIFSDLGATLPLSTRILLTSSHLLRNYFWVLIVAAAAAAFAADRYRRTPAGRLAIDRRMIRLPLVGELVRSIETARFTRTLGTLIQSGVPILQALVLVKDILQNRLASQAMDTVHARVKEGERLSKPLRDSGLFPELAIQMILVGEETGRLDRMLIKVGESYEKAVRVRVKRLINLLEPALILAMGVVVGFIVISMLTAIFSINELPF